ncbi:MAG: glycosyltransferase family 4 protein [Erysipelotrichaceae bacterium]|nr:glycosyltransferase family 4 protein [Erysipelotrichaceae bacterium]
MDNKKILLVGNISSIWLREYICEVLQNNDFDITLLDMSKEGNEFSKEEIDFCKSNSIKVLKNLYNPKTNKLYRALQMYFNLRILRKTEKYDIIHLHFVSVSGLAILKYLKKDNTLTVASFWGSDILRRDKYYAQKMRKYFKDVDVISLTTEKMKEKFVSFFGDIFKKKIKMVYFGLSSLKYIDNNMKYKENIKELFNVPQNKVVISIGYNGNEAQQHLKVLKSIRDLEETIKNRIFIVLPMTYGNPSTVYLSKVNEELSRYWKNNYCIFDKFLDGNELSKLRIISDIFIHAQVTDAMSASVMEYLYSGNIVLNPSWIEYYEHQKNGVKYIQYSKIEDIKTELSKLVLDTQYIEKWNEFKNGNRRVIKRYTWENARKEWLKLYVK